MVDTGRSSAFGRDRLVGEHLGHASSVAGDECRAAGSDDSDTSRPVDQTLTDIGLLPQGGGRVLLLACGAIAHEILAIRAANRWDHLDLQCLPAIYHNHPERIVPAIRAAVIARRADYDRIFVVYADCGTGGLLKAACDELGVAMIAGPHCYSFFMGNEAFTQADDMTAFYLTDFLTRQFDAFVWRPLGLDRHPQLRDTYFGNYTSLIYLAQTDDAVLTAKAEAIAKRMGLAFIRRATGYGDLTSALAQA